jgi:enoyl-[acyl-carrier protein] reductase I
MLLEGKKGLVLNVTNKNSIGWAIADMANKQGARVGIGAQNERLADGVLKLIEGREGFDPFLIDFLHEEEFDRLRSEVESKYGKLDFLVHSVGYAPKEALTGRFIDTNLADFEVAMNASAFSLIRICRALEPLLNDDASVITISYLGSTRIMSSYKVMGVAKAALESSARYLAADLGERGIRVNVVSPGPVNTISARGVSGLTDYIRHVQDVAPLKRAYGQDECARTAMYLLSDLSRGVSGQIVFVDSGYNTVAV